MKKLRFKDSKGKIHEFKNVLLSTGCKDVTGLEIFEGDVIEQPRKTHRYSKKSKTVIVKSIVKVFENNLKRKTVGGIQIPQPIQFYTKQLCETVWGDMIWNEFFKCKLLKKFQKGRS